jgi:hypothetical protein
MESESLLNLRNLRDLQTSTKYFAVTSQSANSLINSNLQSRGSQQVARRCDVWSA